MKHSIRRHAFTLVELLVVIAIIGILIGMLLPAVQSVREAARRTQCLNNIKQLSLACLNYESALSEFPPGINANGTGITRNGAIRSEPNDPTQAQRIGWGVFILPYIEQDNLNSQLKTATDNWDSDWAVATNTNGQLIVSAVISAFICPSDSAPDGDFNKFFTPNSVVQAGNDLHSKSNYVACMGATPFNQGTSLQAALNRPDLAPQNWGVFGFNSKTTFGDINDGSSNVLAIGERSSRTEEESGRTGNNLKDQYGAVWSGAITDGWGAANGSPRNSYNAVLGSIAAENASSFTVNGFRQSESVASGFHTGGANVGFVDGSSHFISDDIAFDTYKAICRMRDGQVVPPF